MSEDFCQGFFLELVAGNPVVLTTLLTAEQCVSQDLKTGGLFFGTRLDHDRNVQPQRDFVWSVYQSNIKSIINSVSHILLFKIQNPKI